MPRKRRARKAEDLCIPIALGCAALAFLWLAYYLYFGPSTDQAGTLIPITAICLNPLTLVFEYTDSLLLFSMLVLSTDLLIYGAVGVLVRNAMRKRSLRKRTLAPASLRV